MLAEALEAEVNLVIAALAGATGGDDARRRRPPDGEVKPYGDVEQTICFRSFGECLYDLGFSGP
ncbi:MAG: hypothetical protein M3460_29830 [Actinomycetota bacterium]|nr:hypothetical protein [Actinomycetota bacterium]